ncbi:MAG TPA: hypothetical protein VH186_16650 [Chloroflexia bacterium]|nr:hypothetical protein [Chloroflexia bacterium]
MTSGELVQVARPAFVVSGQENASLSEGLLSLQIIETVAGLYRCEATFGNWGTLNNNLDYLYFDRQVLDFGKTWQVKQGADILFDGRIMGLEAIFPETMPPAITVLAEDRFQDLRMTRRTRSFSQVSDSDVFNQIAGNHGLTANLDLNGPTYPVLAQVNLSDLAFLRERARSIDAEIWMNGTTLYAKSHASRSNEQLDLTYKQDLREFSVLADLAGQRSSVSVSGWDVAGKQAIKEDADENAISSELSGDTGGTAILNSALGSRKEMIAHSVSLTSREAQAEAQAIFKMNARRFVTAYGIAETSVKLRVGNKVNLRGLGDMFNGKYYLTEVRHRFDGEYGLRTEFRAERPGIGGR